MASGIVSIDLDSGDHGILSAITLWFAVAVWLVLAVMLGMRLLHQRDRFDHEARSPAALTGVAGTAILGTRLVKDYDTAAVVLLVVAGVCWAVLVVPVLRHWKTPTIGVSFVLTAATVSLAVLGANLAVSYRTSWLVSVAAAALVLGLAFYIFTAARFDLRQLIIGHGDHWVAGGALAICALAAGHVTQAVEAFGKLPSLQQVLSTSTLVLWCVAMVWLLPLIICEIVRPRLRYDTRRWATVFPLGIYAAASIETGQVRSITWITDFGHAWTWVGFAAWLLALAGLLYQGLLVLRGRRPGRCPGQGVGRARSFAVPRTQPIG